jgi:hypothetical protein
MEKMRHQVFYFMMVTFILPLHFKLVGLNSINGNLI